MSEEAYVRGRYLAVDPAGWAYGCPNSDDLRSDPALQRELEMRIRQEQAANPELSKAECETRIRLGDRARAEKFLDASSRKGLVAFLGGVYTPPADDPERVDFSEPRRHTDD